MRRKICYITGTRADFGLMQSALQAIRASERLELSIIVTGTHLTRQYGCTVREIEAAGLPVSTTVRVDTEPPTGATMARNVGRMLTAFVDELRSICPDLVLLLGDRGEMLAGAIAAIHLNIPVAHIHGGERSGTVDEPVRHAISRLSHFHFTATQAARERLIRMGEIPAHVYVTGAPGLDGLQALAWIGREQLLRDVGFDLQKPVALLVYHPVLQEAERAGEDVERVLQALAAREVQVVAMKPNSDAGADRICQVLQAHVEDAGVRVVTHFPRAVFVSWMAAVDLMIGNSSAGIIEAATFGTPVVNIGTRQKLRERNANVIDVPCDASSVEAAVYCALEKGRFPPKNIYGDGGSSLRIVDLLERVSLGVAVLMKTNAY